MLLSIIIPVYNVQNYVEKCIRSCEQQDISHSEYEVIIVNDGSTDNSLCIVESIASQYSNIRIISQTNQGLSVARNVGMQHAIGEYVWFIDSDDWIEPGCLKRICRQLNSDLDILQLKYRLVYDDATKNVEGLFTKFEGVLSGKEIILKGGLYVPAPFAIYRLDFLKKKNLSFVPNIIHEDFEFKPRVTYLAEKISSDSSVSYNYLQRTSGNICSTFNIKKCTDILIVMNNLYQFTNTYNLEIKYSIFFYDSIGMIMNTLLFDFKRLSSKDKDVLMNEVSKNTHLFKIMCKSRKFKYKLEGILFLICPKLGFKLYDILK